MRSNEILVVYGNKPKTMVKEILNQVNLGAGEINPNALIGIKPNLVVAKPSSSGATTSPELVAGVIEYLQEHGFQRIIIFESSWIGERTSNAFRTCGYQELAERYGVPLVDLKEDQYKEYEVKGTKIKVCNKALEVDYLINIPVLKGHCQTKLTCALKNMKGCIPDSEKRRFHTLGLQKPIAYLNKLLKQNLIIVDGMMGDLDFEEGGNPVPMNRIIVGKDPVLIDAYAAELLGYDLKEIPYITMAAEIGAGCADLANASIRELNRGLNTVIRPRSRKAEELAEYVTEQNACSACYGSLIHALARLKEQGLLGQLDRKIYIGQGYRGKQGQGIGVGRCAMGFEHHIDGCPPKAKEIIDFLIDRSLLK